MYFTLMNACNMSWEEIREAPNYLLAVMWEQAQFDQELKAYAMMPITG